MRTEYIALRKYDRHNLMVRYSNKPFALLRNCVPVGRGQVVEDGFADERAARVAGAEEKYVHGRPLIGVESVE